MVEKFQKLFKNLETAQKPRLSRKVLILTGGLFFLLILGFLLWSGIFFTFSLSGEKVIFDVQKGQTLKEISANLKKAGLINSPFLFNLVATLKGAQKNLKAGRYELSPSMSISEILKKFTEGKGLSQITIIEGWDLQNIAWYLEGEGLFTAEEFLQTTGFPGADFNKNPELAPKVDFAKEFDFLKQKPENISLEGYLFPDTYQVLPGDTIEDIVKRMLKNFKKKVLGEKEWLEKIASQGRSLHEVLTMASLLEKELKDYEDKRIAAGILWKRLRSGWLLQVDATVGYLTGKSSRELTKEDLNLDSPYNTYRYPGLPPGPICNPGLESIKAAIFYKQSPYWFYLTTPDGKTIFSRTLREHNINKAKYLK